MEAYVEVVHSDGSVDRTPMRGERVVIGSAPTVDVPLVSLEGVLSPRHFSVRLERDGCFVSSLDADSEVPVLLRGVPFQQGKLPWGSEVEVGGVRLRLVDRPTGTSEGRTVLLFFGLLVLAAAVYGGLRLLPTSGTQLPQRFEKTAPPLFGDASVTCGTAAPMAEGRARDAAEAAQVQAERYPFDVRDGVRAVLLYETSAACFQAVGEPRLAKTQDRRRAALMGRINDDYRAERLRLEHALERERLDEAIEASQRLQHIVGEGAGDYYRWLVQAERKLKMLLAAERKKQRSSFGKGS